MDAPLYTEKGVVGEEKSFATWKHHVDEIIKFKGNFQKVKNVFSFSASWNDDSDKLSFHISKNFSKSD